LEIPQEYSEKDESNLAEGFFLKGRFGSIFGKE
jgi:hypothetical protein